jgi:hypothetical protein
MSNRKQGIETNTKRIPYLDIIHNDRLCIQQEPKLGFVHPFKRSLEILIAIPVLFRGENHECRIGTFEAHVEHTLDAHAASLKTLLGQLAFHVLREFI